MNRLILLLVLFSFSSLSYGQLPVPVDSLYTFIKSNSIHRNTVDWNKVDTAFQSRIKNASSTRDTMKSFVYVLEQLNDVHTQLYLNNQYYGHYPDFDDSTLAWLTPLNNKANATANRITTTMLPGKVAYVSVPSFQAYGPAQINEYAQALYDSVYSLSQKKPAGFIVDLRLNGGGNIYPMLSGLSALLGNITVAYETDMEDHLIRTWEMKNGNFIISGYKGTDILTKPLDLTKKPVVVLTGPVTRSSGSMTAIAFKQRPKTTFLGEPTADGYTTSNGYFQFAPNLFLNFATNFVADRKKNIYKTTVNPDVVIYYGDDFENLSQDKKIIAALKWLAKNR